MSIRYPAMVRLLATAAIGFAAAPAVAQVAAGQLTPAAAAGLLLAD